MRVKCKKVCKKEEKHVKEKKIHVRYVNHVKVYKSKKMQGYMKGYTKFFTKIILIIC